MKPADKVDKQQRHLAEHLRSQLAWLTARLADLEESIRTGKPPAPAATTTLRLEVERRLANVPARTRSTAHQESPP